MRRPILLLLFVASSLHVFAQETAPAHPVKLSALDHAPTNELFPEPTGEIVLRVDYENGNGRQPDSGVIAEGPLAKDAFSISGQTPRSGKFCLQTKVAHSDDYISYGKHRAETTTLKRLPSRYNESEVFRYRFSFRMQEDWQFDNRDSVDIIWQFKRFDGSPDMFIAVKGDSIVLRGPAGGQWTLIQKCTPGEWFDLCIISRWSAGPTGFVEAFAKRAHEEQYAKVASFHGPNTRDARSNSSYLTWGIYKPGMNASTTTSPHVIFHDAIVVEKLVPPQRSKEIPKTQ